jgi:hypothetical protein
MNWPLVVFLCFVGGALAWFGLWIAKVVRIQRRIDKWSKLSEDIKNNPTRENLNRAAKEFETTRFLHYGNFGQPCPYCWSATKHTAWCKRPKKEKHK